MTGNFFHYMSIDSLCDDCSLFTDRKIFANQLRFREDGDDLPVENWTYLVELNRIDLRGDIHYIRIQMGTEQVLNGESLSPETSNRIRTRCSSAYENIVDWLIENDFEVREYASVSFPKNLRLGRTNSPGSFLRFDKEKNVFVRTDQE